MEQFWNGKRVLLTGDTGFKGSWMALWLNKMGAIVQGLSLPPDKNQPSLFSLIKGEEIWSSAFGDIQNVEEIIPVVKASDPEIVIHMAGQAIVGSSYIDPLNTYGTNIMGTANLLWALQHHSSVKAVLVITSDKVYENHDTGLAFTEEDRLGGDDPYSASKAAAELVVSSWRKSFFEKMNIPIVTARGSNVIGGGDWSHDRLIPNYIRSIENKKDAFVMRNPSSIRAWQHVMDTINGYLNYIMRVYEGEDLPLSLNFGPSPEHSLTAGAVINMLQEYMHYPTIVNQSRYDKPYPEKNTLLIDPSKAERVLSWQPLISPEESLLWTAQWYNEYFKNSNVYDISLEQIKKYEDIKDAAQLSLLQDAVGTDFGGSRENAFGK